MKLDFNSKRILLFLVIILLFNSLVEGSHRHAGRRLFPERRTNRTFENNTYKKYKKNFLDSYERNSGVHPLCHYPNVMALTSRTSPYVEFYKRRCNHHSYSGDHERGPTAPKLRSVRNPQRRQNKKNKNELSPKKEKKIKKLLAKTECRTFKTMVPVVGPDASEEFYPCMVVVNRCSGCCFSRLSECVPTKTRIRKFDVLRSSHLANRPIYKAKIEEHVKCECKCKVKASDCGPGQIYEEKNCLCKCPDGSYKTCHQTKRWSERDCDCMCKKEKERDCSSGLTVNNDTCLCEQPQRYSHDIEYDFPNTAVSSLS